jgi:hypothetical protein
MDQLALTLQPPAPRTGRQIRDRVLAELEQRRASYVNKARAFAVDFARRWGVVSINDVRNGCPPPADVPPAALGAVFKQRIWTVVSFTQANHPAAHARIVRVYKLKGENRGRKGHP